MNSRFKKKAFQRPREQDSEYDCESSLLLPSDAKDSDDETTLYGRHLALRPKRPVLHYIEHTLQSGENLSSLALRYNCSVSQIKQANNILRENEVFALRNVRIPVPAFSSLRDDVPGVHSSPLSIRKAFGEERNENSPSTETIPLTLVDGGESNRSDEELHDPLLTPIPLPKLPLVDISDSEPPDLELSFRRVPEKVSEGLFHCSGADCGISWVALVACMLVLGFVGPLIYVFFLYEHEQERKVHNYTQSHNHTQPLNHTST